MIFEIISTTFIFVILVIVWFGLGNLVMSKFRSLEDRPPYLLAVYPLIGMAVFTNVALVLGIFGQLTPVLVWIMIILSGIISRKYIHLPRIQLKLGKLELVLSLLLLSIFANYYLTCFAPPFRWDELAYHLPESLSISDNGKTIFPLAGEKLFGQLPAFMEILYAVGIIISGVSLAHIFHFFTVMCLVGFVLIYFYGKKNLIAGLLFGIGVFYTTEFISYSTSLYVDIASSIFEVISVLLLVEWARFRDESLLHLIAILLGTGISIKYSVLYSLPVYLLIAAVYCFRDRLKALLGFVLLIIIFGGFWYIKNWFITGTPLFPYQLTAKGIVLLPEFISVDTLVKQFDFARNMGSFINIPYLFFVRNNQFLYGPIMFCLSLLSFFYFRYEQKRIAHILPLVVLSKFALWFFLISHQIRLVYSAILLLVYMGSLVAAKNPKFLMPIISFIAIFFLINLQSISPKSILIYASPYKLAELKLVSGIMSKTDYLARMTGDIYYITNFLNANVSNQKVLNYWNQTAAFYLINGNTYIQDTPQREDEYEKFISDNKIQYIAVDLHLRNSFVGSIGWDGWWQPRNNFETFLVSHSELVFKTPNDWARLYKIHL